MHNFFKVKSPIIKLLGTILYVILVLVIHYTGIGCLFRRFFNIYCPGCGLTTAYLAVFRLDFVSAFKANFMFWAIPIIYLYFWYDGKLTGKKVADNIIMILIFLGFLVRLVLRYLP